MAKNYSIKFGIFSVFILSQSALTAKTNVIEDGVSIQEPGVFYDKCYYGKNESLSDHAPVIYGKFATWNIASPLNHYKVQAEPAKPANFFFNHKFFTDDKGNLIDREGRPIGFLGTSEMILLKSVYTPEKIKQMIHVDYESIKNIDKDKLRIILFENYNKLKKITDLKKYGEYWANRVRIFLDEALPIVKNEMEDLNEDEYRKIVGSIMDIINIKNLNDEILIKSYNKLKIMIMESDNYEWVDSMKKTLSDTLTLAQNEVSNPDESKYRSTIELLRVMERGKASVTNMYINRVEMEASKIRGFFKDKELDYMVLQEVPESDEQTQAGENLQVLIKELFQPPQDLWMEAVKKLAADPKFNEEKMRSVLAEEPARIGDRDPAALSLLLKLAITVSSEELDRKISQLFASNSNTIFSDLDIKFYDPNSPAGHLTQTAVSKTKFKKGMIPDVAIVYRKSAPPLVQEIADHDNRFVPWCAEETKTCFVAVHMPSSKTPEELKTRCNDMQNMALKLHEKGYSSIKFAGDFNTNAGRMSRECYFKIPNAKSVELHTTPGQKPNSCGSNQGHQVAPNIDVQLVVEF